MIMKGRITLQLFITDGASIDTILKVQSLVNMFLTMLSHIVNDTIRLRHSLEFTAGAR
jgi:hypothetical protein